MNIAWRQSRNHGNATRGFVYNRRCRRASLMVDFRVEWFRERVLSLLGEKDDEVFSELLAREEGLLRDQLVAFIGDSISQVCRVESRLVFFYKTFHQRVIQHEVVVAKKAPEAKVVKPTQETKFAASDDDSDRSDHSRSPPLPRAPPPSAAKSKKGAGGGKKGRSSVQRSSTSSDSKTAKKAGQGVGKGAKKGRKSPSTVVETVTDVEESTPKVDPEEEPTKTEEVDPYPQVTYVTRINKEVVQLPVLHCKFGALSEEQQNLPDTTFLMFLRRFPDGMKPLDSWDAACSEMPAAFIVGSFVGPVLPALCLLLEKVFTPLLAAEVEATPTRFSSLDTTAPSTRHPSFVAPKAGAGREDAPSRSASLVPKPRAVREDQLTIPGLLQEIKPLTQWLLQYEQSQPTFDLTPGASAALDKIHAGESVESFLPDLEPVCSAWVAQIQTRLNDNSKRQRGSEGPLAEIVFWEDQEAALSGLHWRLQSPAVCRLREALSTSEAALELTELAKQVALLLAEARAITRSLSPAAGHFRELSEGSSLVGMRHVLVRLMDGLRLVWVLCSPYARDERMEPLLERVAWLLCHKVALRLHMDTLFRQGAEKAMLKAKQGAKLLRTWKDLYYQTRQTIEVSGHTPRWEFDCRKLFGHSEYIREVCVDLTEICKVLINFRSVLTPELKAVIDNPGTVDALLKRVSALIAPIQQDADFEVFMAGNSDSWRSFINHFRRNVLMLEQDVCEFFQQALTIGNISSSRDALKLLVSLTSADTREAVRTVLTSKFELVIGQFMEEVQVVSASFLASKDAPPLLRNQPLAAGAILWCRSLFNRLKSAVLLFQDVKELQRCAVTDEAFSAYVQITRQMKSFQDLHYETWLTKAEDVIKKTVDTNVVKVMKKPEKRRSVGGVERRLGGYWGTSESRADRSSTDSSRLMLRPVLASLRWVARAIAARKQRSSTATETSSVLPHIGLEATSASVASLGLQYEVEFNDLLLEVLAEAELMEHLGLELTPLIRRHAIHRASLDQTVRRLRETVRKMNQLVAPLDKAEVALLQLALKDAERAIEPGVNRLKWTSRSLTEYSEACENAVVTLSSSIQQVKFCSQQASEQVNLLKNYNLFYVPEAENCEVLPWVEYFQKIEEHRAESVKEMTQRYKSLSSILITLEHWIDKTNTGRKVCMKKYYLFWEQKLFEALLAMTMKNLQHFSGLLQGNAVCFEMDARLEGTELCLSPSAVDAYDLLVSDISELLFTLRGFVRWMAGTCEPCPDPEVVPEPGQPVGRATKLFSFLDDVTKVQQVKEQVTLIKDAAQDVLVKTRTALFRWRKYKLLWEHDKTNTCAIFGDKKPSLVAYDEKFVYFSNIILKLERSPPSADVGCVRLNLRPLIRELKEHARGWKVSLAQGFAAHTKRRMRSFLWMAFTLKVEMEQKVDPENPESLKEVLDAIVKIRQTNSEAEVQANHIEESYRTMTLYDIEVDEGDLRMSQELWPMWDFLYLSSLVRTEELEPLRQRYARETLESVAVFVASCEDLVARFSGSGPGCVGRDLDRGLLLMAQFAAEIEALDNQRDGLRQDELLFDVPLADHSALQDVQTQMESLQQVFQLYAAQKAARESWASTLWVDLAAGSLIEGMKQFHAQFAAISAEAQALPVARQLEQDMREFQNSVPLFEALKNEALRERHWQQLMERTGRHFDISPESFTLQSLFAMELHSHEEAAAAIVESATRELVIEQALQEVRKAWGEQEFALLPHLRDSEDIGVLLGPVDNILQLLAHHSATLRQIFTSPYVGPFLASVEEWEKTLATVSETVGIWVRAQQQWLNLETVFTNPEILAQLPAEALAKFEVCDKGLRLVLAETSKNPLAVSACCRAGCLEELRELQGALQECQRTLNAFLASKRQVFSRLNFVTDNELLSLLGGKLPQCIQAEVAKMKLFPNISALEVEEGEGGQLIVTGLVSKDGERLVLRPPLDTARCEVESWLNQLVPGVHTSLSYSVKSAIHDFGHTNLPQEQWVPNFLGMVSLAALRVWWTARVEDVFEKIKMGSPRAMKEYLEELNQQVEDISIHLNTIQDTIQRVKLTSALILNLHFRDVIVNLIYNGVTKTDDYLWDSQLRFYWNKAEDTLYVHQCCCRLEFGFDYTGLHESLVSTPQTDRIMLIITQALFMQLGVILSGDSGVGKTETVREMARVLGRLCLVTDCNANMNWRSVGNILSGLAQSGLWGCLEQLDRLDPSTLSVLSSQLQVIRSAVVMRLSSFNFNGMEICLDSKMAVFASVSPGQEGRHELPQTLRTLFRPAASEAPDLRRVCYVGLLTAGFAKAQILAKKITELCKFCTEQLSYQAHYNFGMCQIKSILKLARKVRTESPDQSEDSIALFVLTRTITPKLVAKDVELFFEIIKDMFPRVEAPAICDARLREAVETSLTDEGYVVLPRQVEKVLELNDALEFHSAAMLIGPSGGGKSVIGHTLARAQTKLGCTTKVVTLCPKSCSSTEFFGTIDPESELWRDGLFSHIFRNLNDEDDSSEDSRIFVIFDSHIDPLWIENINSVLDENKLMTLANGDRILLQKCCSFLFEVGDLNLSSPSILSRACTIFVTSSDLGHEPSWCRWLKSHSELQPQLEELYQKYVPTMLEVTENMATILPFTPLNMISQLCYILDALLLDAEDIDNSLSCYFVQALYLSLGGMLLEEHRAQFDLQLKETSGLEVVEDSPDTPAGRDQLPTSSLFSYVWEPQRQAWVNWQWQLPAYQHDPATPLDQILVPTPQTAQTSWLMSRATKYFFHGLVFQKTQRPLVLVGTSGSSKTATIQTYLKGLDLSLYSQLSLTLSSSSSSAKVQSVLEGALQRRTRGVMEPPLDKKLIVFLDDLHMPVADKYGTQEPIEFLRLLFEHGGFYDRGKELSWKQLKDVGFLGALTCHNGGGSSGMDARFLAQLCLLHLPSPSQPALQHLFSQVLAGHLQTFPEEVHHLAESLVAASLHLFQLLRELLPPTPARWTCHLGVRDLTRLFGGLCLAQPHHFSRPETLVRVWRHEVCRVFCDRLEQPEDQALVNRLLETTLQEFYAPFAEHALRDPILFGDFRNALNDTERWYEDLLDFEAVFFLFQEVLEELNRRGEGPRLELVLFDSALEHLARLHRVLRMFRGHAVLVGGPGVGRRSLTRLAVCTAHCHPRELTTPLRTGLQDLYRLMGLHGKAVALLVSDADMTREEVPELVHHMLSTGWIPGLFTNAEKDEIISLLKDTHTEREAAWLDFQRRCVSRMHVVLSVSKTTLKKHSQQYPSLLTATMLDWFHPWPQDALSRVAKYFIANNPLVPEIHRGAVQAHSVWVHGSAGHHYQRLSQRHLVTNSPRLYLDYIRCYLALLEENTNRNKTERERLSAGLARISQARGLLNQLGTRLAQREATVVQHTAACQDLLQQIDKVSTSANEKREMVAEWTRTAERQERILVSERTQAQQILDTAQPALDAARGALENLGDEHLNEISSLETPPEQLRVVSDCLLLLQGMRDVPWDEARSIVGDAARVRQLGRLRCEGLASKHIRMIKVQLKKATQMEDLPAISPAGAVFLVFVQAVLGYCTVLREVAPKLEVVAHLEAELKQSRGSSSLLAAEVAREEAQLAELQGRHADITRELHTLQDEAERMHRHLAAAEKLFSSLDSEEARWESQLAQVDSSMARLPGNCLLAAAMLSYAGPLGPGPRQEALAEWCEDLEAREVPLTRPFQPELQLSSPEQRSRWNSFLSDAATLQNLLMMTRAIRYPLCIDPQQQASQWVQLIEEGVCVTSTNDPELSQQLENAVREGQSLMVQDVGNQVDPALYNLLDKVLLEEGDETFVSLQGKKVPFNPEFKLFLNTREANPKFEPLVYTKTTVIDCTITPEALECCLLSDVVRGEEASLQARADGLALGVQGDARSLQTLEQSLLDRLALAPEEGLLEDPQLLVFLEDTKAKITQLSQQLQASRSGLCDLESSRQRFLPAAQRCALLFSVLADLAHLAPTYHFSLAAFRTVLRASTQQAPAKDELAERLAAVVDTVTRNTHSFTCRGLFTQHHLSFTLTLLLRIQLSEGLVSPLEVAFLTAGGPDPAQQGEPSWMSAESYGSVTKLSTTLPQVFGDLAEDVQHPDWEEWSGQACPEAVRTPGDYHERLSPFQKLLLLRCLRKDRVIPAVQDYVRNSLGEHFITPIIPSMRSLLKESCAEVPVLLLLSQGADPGMELQRLSRQCGRDSGQFVSLALGHGQQAAAVGLLQNAVRRGQWLLLLNCHLVPEVPALVWRLLERSRPHPDFRLWLTSDSTPHLPPSLLQTALKVVLETPKGLKLKLNNTFRKLEGEAASKCSHAHFLRLLYVLAHLHATLQERVVYGGIGWNATYNFTKSDFDASIVFLENTLEKMKSKTIPWSSLQALVGKVVYGGYMKDPYDLSIVCTYLQEFCGDFIFSDKFNFYQDKNTSYALPPLLNTFGILAYIQSLPMANSCVVLGLHSNAEIRHNEVALRLLANHVATLQPQQGDPLPGLSLEERGSQAVAEVSSRLPSPLDTSELLRRLGSGGPGVAFVLQELEAFNGLLEAVRRSLELLEQALRGQARMTSVLAELLSCLTEGEVPPTWRDLCPPTNRTLSDWVTLLRQRHVQYYDWIMKHEPLVVWLPGLHAPRSFLLAVLHAACRTHHWPLEQAGLRLAVTSAHHLPAMRDGTYVRGLHLENAGWDSARGCLKPAEIGQLTTPFPVVAVTAVEKVPDRLPGSVRTPLYATRRQGPHISLPVWELDLPSAEHPSTWILQGVRLLLDPE